MIYDIQTMIQGVKAEEQNERVNLLPYLKVLKYVMGADGEIAPAEWSAFQEEMTRLKVSDEIAQQVVDFQIEGVQLSDITPQLEKDSFRARMLLRDAIHIAMADEVYAPEEKQAVHEVGLLLGVPQFIIHSLEALVEMEYAATHLKDALL